MGWHPSCSVSTPPSQWPCRALQGRMDAQDAAAVIEALSRAQRRRDAARAKRKAMTKEERNLVRREERQRAAERVEAIWASAGGFDGWDKMPSWDNLAATAADLEPILLTNTPAPVEEQSTLAPSLIHHALRGTARPAASDVARWGVVRSDHVRPTRTCSHAMSTFRWRGKSGHLPDRQTEECAG